MRIRGKGFLTKKACKLMADSKRKKFSKMLHEGNLKYPASSFIENDFDIISVSGKKHYEEQTLSILSFCSNVGVPKKWTIFSDGSYSDQQKENLTKLFPFISIKNWSDLPNRHPEYTETLNNYTSNYNIGKKTYVILNYFKNRYLYFDSDLVFYPTMKDYLHLFNSHKFNYFSVDNDWCCLDPMYMKNKKQDMYQLNSGILFIQPNFNWEPALKYLKQVSGKYQFFDQTSIHEAFFSDQNQAVLPFDPRVFKVEMKDHFKFKISPETKNLAVRHYVGPVRHKIWQKGWNWHIGNFI